MSSAIQQEVKLEKNVPDGRFEASLEIKNLERELPRFLGQKHIIT